MTDKERWLEFFASYGLRPTDGYLHEPKPTSLIFEADYGGVVGYSGFEAEVKFNDKGEFVEFGVWE